MDIELAKSLKQIEAKKKTINAESDLTSECKTIIELDHRIGLLLKEVKNLRDSIDEQTDFICDTYDQLEPNYDSLERTSGVFDLASDLTKLNRLCRRFNNNSHIFKFLENPNQVLPGSSVRRASLTKGDNGGPGNDGNGNENDELTSQILSDCMDKFESIYQPLEAILSGRNDLPYASYANKVRNLKLSMNITTSSNIINGKEQRPS